MNILDIKLDPKTIPWTWFNQSGQDKDLAEIVPDWEGSDVPADMLATIFAGQKVLYDKYHDIEDRNGCIVIDEKDFGELDDRRVQMRLKDLGYRVVEELSEATNCLKNKPWKNTFVETDRDHFYEELADALHFLVELLMTAGLSAEDVFKLYYRKHAVNQFRQGSNY